MSPFPTELITLFGSSLAAGLMRLYSGALEAKRLERLATLTAISHKQQFASIPVSSVSAKELQWTRRLISLLAVFFIIVYPKLVAVFMPQLPIHVGYHESKAGFLFFSSNMECIRWVSLKGLVITPLDTHLLSAIIGLYFGGSLVGKR